MCEDLTKLPDRGSSHFGRLSERVYARSQTPGEEDEVPDESVAFVWNADCLTASIQRRHLVICSEGELRGSDIGLARVIYILAELCWGNRRPSDLYGLTVLRRLRVERDLLCPIAICSFMPETHFERGGSGVKGASAALGLPGHVFVRLPFTSLSAPPMAARPELTESDMLRSMSALYSSEEVRGFIGSDHHHGVVLQNLTTLIRGVEALNAGRTGIVSQSPFSDAGDLKKIRKDLLVVVSFVVSNSLFAGLTPREVVALERVLDKSQLIDMTFKLLIESADDRHRRVERLRQLDLAAVADEMQKLAGVLLSVSLGHPS